MKYYITLLGILLFSNSWVSAQQFSGIATYKSATQATFSLGNEEGLSDTQKEDMQAALRKALQKEFDLSFDLMASNWKEKESLGGTPEVQSGGFQIKIKAGSSLMYKNVKERQVIEEQDVFGKPFLIKDSLERFKWKLVDEHKQIGNYRCQKATFQQTRTRKEITFGTENDGEKTVTDTVHYVAWYTSDIPVSHGPAQYWGLPGLIMEVTDGRTTFICSKLVINPKEGITLTIPEKGKVVTREEFQTIQNEKLQEMSEQFKGKEDGQVIIKIGG